eukprot:6191340-Pleurochrysis_carterae.AAC.1
MIGTNKYARVRLFFWVRMHTLTCTRTLTYAQDHTRSAGAQRLQVGARAHVACASALVHAIQGGAFCYNSVQHNLLLSPSSCACFETLRAENSEISYHLGFQDGFVSKMLISAQVRAYPISKFVLFATMLKNDEFTNPALDEPEYACEETWTGKASRGHNGQLKVHNGQSGARYGEL